MSHGAAEAGAATDPATGPDESQLESEGAGQDQDGSAEGETQEAEDQTDWKAEAERWKKLSRQNEQRAKDNSAAARRLKEIDDANKTELEKAQERAAQAERERDESRMGHARIMAAATHDLPVDLIDLLGTGTDDEIDERGAVMANAIEQRASEIAEQTVQNARRAVEALGIPWPLEDGGNGNGSARTAAGAASRAQRPVESLFSGAVSSSQRTAGTNEDLFRQMLHPE